MSKKKPDPEPEPEPKKELVEKPKKKPGRVEREMIKIGEVVTNIDERLKSYEDGDDDDDKEIIAEIEGKIKGDEKEKPSPAPEKEKADGEKKAYPRLDFFGRY